MIEHPAMQTAQERFAQDISLAAECPLVGFENVLLLKLVEFFVQRDVRREQPVAFLGREWCSAMIRFGRAGHFSSQRRAGRRRSSSIDLRLSSSRLRFSFTD